MFKRHPYLTLLGVYLLTVLGFGVIQSLRLDLAFGYIVGGALLYWLIPLLVGAVATLVVERKRPRSGSCLLAGVGSFTVISGLAIIGMLP